MSCIFLVLPLVTHTHLLVESEGCSNDTKLFQRVDVSVRSRERKDASTSLVALRNRSPRPSPSARLIEPIYYVHVPKAGSSFGTAIAHLACGGKIPEKMTVNEPGETSEWKRKCGSDHINSFSSGHWPLNLTETALSKVVLMLRPTRARIISGFINNLHDCVDLQTELRLNEHGRSMEGKVDAKLLRRYVDCVQSCTTNMLVGKYCGEGAIPLWARGNSLQKSVEHSSSDVKEASARLEKVGFVGLTDQWDLSICLWHAMFGGSCLPAEFTNTRKTTRTLSNDERDMLASFKLVDDAIYSKARERFLALLETYGVTPQSCANEFCPRMAHIFGGHGAVLPNAWRETPGKQDGVDWLQNLTWPGRMFFYED